MKKKHGKEPNDKKAQTEDKVRKFDPKIKKKDPEKLIREKQEIIEPKNKEKIIKGALEEYYNTEELKPYQAELIKLQRHLENTGKKIVILFDGRDASGKGGTMRRITRYMNEKRYRVVVLGKPSAQQKTELQIKRYIEHFPRAG